MRERTVVVNGFSKAYAMTGWRLGYAAGPAPILKQMTKIHQFAIMCAPTTSQYAAVEALRHCDDEIEAMVVQYDMRRRLLVDSLNQMGLSCFCTGRRVLCIPQYPVHRTDFRGSSASSFCIRKRSPWSRAMRSASQARDLSASPILIRWIIFWRRCGVSRRFWNSTKRRINRRLKGLFCRFCGRTESVFCPSAVSLFL